MTIQELVYELRSEGLSLFDIKNAVFQLLDNEGYVINKYTHIVIEKHCKNWDSLQGVA